MFLNPEMYFVIISASPLEIFLMLTRVLNFPKPNSSINVPKEEFKNEDDVEEIPSKDSSKGLF
jgi:hypothetical protein